MTQETTGYVPDVSASAEEERAARNGTAPADAKPRVFDCTTCGDTGEVRILFSSPTGLMPGKASIACPDCKAGKVKIGDVGERFADLEGAIRLLKRTVLIALLVATIALLWRRIDA